MKCLIFLSTGFQDSATPLPSSDTERCFGEQDTMPVWLSSLLVVSSLLVLSTFTLSKSRYSLSKNLILIIFLDEVTSRSPTKNFPPHICPHFAIRLSKESLWKLDVKTKSYPSPSKSLTSDARQRRVLTSVALVCAVSVNFLQLGIPSVYHAWTHSSIARRNGSFWSPLTIAFLK